MSDDQTLDDDGKAILEPEGVEHGAELINLATRERIKGMRQKDTGGADAASPAETPAALITRRLDTVDLIVQGASLRQVAERHEVDYFTARNDYYEGLAMLSDRTAKAVVAMRDEVTMRQKALIFANMKLAQMGDSKAATVVQNADSMLVSLWGLRSVRLEAAATPDSPLREALNTYRERAAGITG
jgi:hypothetical protein